VIHLPPESDSSIWDVWVIEHCGCPDEVLHVWYSDIMFSLPQAGYHVTIDSLPSNGLFNFGLQNYFPNPGDPLLGQADTQPLRPQFLDPGAHVARWPGGVPGRGVPMGMPFPGPIRGVPGRGGLPHPKPKSFLHHEKVIMDKQTRIHEAYSLPSIYNPDYGVFQTCLQADATYGCCIKPGRQIVFSEGFPSKEIRTAKTKVTLPNLFPIIGFNQPGSKVTIKFKIPLDPPIQQDSLLFQLPNDILAILPTLSRGDDPSTPILETCRLSYQLFSPFYRWLDVHTISHKTIGFYADLRLHYSTISPKVFGFEIRADGTWRGRYREPQYQEHVLGTWCLTNRVDTVFLELKRNGSSPGCGIPPGSQANPPPGSGDNPPPGSRADPIPMGLGRGIGLARGGSRPGTPPSEYPLFDVWPMKVASMREAIDQLPQPPDPGHHRSSTVLGPKKLLAVPM